MITTDFEEPLALLHKLGRQASVRSLVYSIYWNMSSHESILSWVHNYMKQKVSWKERG